MANDMVTAAPVPMPQRTDVQDISNDRNFRETVEKIVEQKLAFTMGGKRLISESEYQDLRATRLKNYAIVGGVTMAATLGGSWAISKIRNRNRTA